ncbi:MAG: bifunctional folylpolyglutamate synthase/dihydrofolate synthase, partial [Pseudomonadota bacterium]
PAAGEALAATLARLPARPTHLVCGMLNTKDVVGYMRPLATRALSLHAVSIPGENATLSSAETAAAAREAGLAAHEADSVEDAVTAILKDAPNARILICGSLYFAGHVLRTHA